MKQAKSKYHRQHWTWSSRDGKQKAKMGFKTLDECLLYIERNSELRQQKKELSPYICSECGMWHIGHYKEK